MSRVWIVRAGPGGKYIEAFMEHSMIAVASTPQSESIERDMLSIPIEYSSEIPDEPARRAAIQSAAAQLRHLTSDIKIGDWIVTPDWRAHQLIYGRVTGPYHYEDRPTIGNCHNTVPVEWLGVLSRDTVSAIFSYDLGSVLSVSEVSSPQAFISLFTTDGEEGAT